jgi:hypothetical protein
MDIIAILREEIDRTAHFMASDALRRARPPRVRILPPAPECQMEMSPHFLEELRQRPDRESMLEGFTRTCANIARSQLGAENCVVSATILGWHGKRAAVPRFIVAFGLDPEEPGLCLCMGRKD